MKIVSKKTLRKILPVAFFIAWLLISSELYHVINDWPFATAFYATVDACYSIGFGSIPHESDESMVLTIVNVCVGAGLIAGVLALLTIYATQLIKDVADKERKVLEKLHLKAKKKDEEDETGSIDFSVSEVKEKLTVMYYAVKVKIAENHLFFATLFLLSTWIAFGMAMMHHFNPDWGFIMLLYFALTAMSTGGHLGPSVIPAGCTDDCVLKDSEAIFIGIFSLIGVPLFGVMIGFTSKLLVERSTRIHEREIMTNSLERDEEIIEEIGLKDDDEITWGDFLTIKLVAMDKIDVETSLELRKVFNILDDNNSGTISKKEAERSSVSINEKLDLLDKIEAEDCV